MVTYRRKVKGIAKSTENEYRTDRWTRTNQSEQRNDCFTRKTTRYQYPWRKNAVRIIMYSSCRLCTFSSLESGCYLHGPNLWINCLCKIIHSFQCRDARWNAVTKSPLIHLDKYKISKSFVAIIVCFDIQLQLRNQTRLLQSQRKQKFWQMNERRTIQRMVRVCLHQKLNKVLLHNYRQS